MESTSDKFLNIQLDNKLDWSRSMETVKKGVKEATLLKNIVFFSHLQTIVTLVLQDCGDQCSVFGRSSTLDRN